MLYKFVVLSCFLSDAVRKYLLILKNTIQHITLKIRFLNSNVVFNFYKSFIRILLFIITLTLDGQESTLPTLKEEDKKTSEKENGIMVQGKKDKRDIEIFKTPSSISRFNEQDILDKGISRTNDIDKQVPNFAIIDSGARNFTYYNIRGMRSTLFSDPSVGLIIDGVPLVDNVALNTELFALDSIEVHRGSQATVFAKNFQGGVIEINTKKPNNMPQGRFMVDWGNYKRRNILFL